LHPPQLRDHHLQFLDLASAVEKFGVLFEDEGSQPVCVESVQIR